MVYAPQAQAYLVARRVPTIYVDFPGVFDPNGVLPVCVPESWCFELSEDDERAAETAKDKEEM